MAARQLSLTQLQSGPAGFVYRDDVLSAAAELALVEQFAALPFKPFEFGPYLGKRRIVSFGFHYDYADRALKESAAMPGFLLDLREIAGVFAGVPAAALEQVLITEYAPGAGIGWHRDKPMFRDVIAFSFLAPCVLRFRRALGGVWDRRKYPLQPRSAYILRDAARWEWEHSIPAVGQLRYSVTFRNFVDLHR